MYIYCTIIWYSFSGLPSRSEPFDRRHNATERDDRRHARLQDAVVKRLLPHARGNHYFRAPKCRAPRNRKPHAEFHFSRSSYVCAETIATTECTSVAPCKHTARVLYLMRRPRSERGIFHTERSQLVFIPTVLFVRNINPLFVREPGRFFNTKSDPCFYLLYNVRVLLESEVDARLFESF